jgi:prepilin-type N-terminal cleavage/methylation domain-containing protein
MSIFHASGEKCGFTLIEMIIAIGIVSTIIAAFLGVLVSAQNALKRTLVDSYVRETAQSSLEIISSDVRGLVWERTYVPARSADFEGAKFAAADPAARAARDLGIVILKRDYIDRDGRTRPADVLFLRTTGAGDAEAGQKVNPVCRVLYALCLDDGDGDCSNDRTVIALSQNEIAAVKNVSLVRCAWYSRDAFAALELPGADIAASPSEKSLLAKEVVGFEVRVMTDGGSGFARRTLVFPDVSGERPLAIEIVITLKDPYTHEEHEVHRAFAVEALECY